MRRLVLPAAVFALGIGAATALAAGSGSRAAAEGTLTATVGPGYTISLTENGAPVTNLAPGSYTIDVTDQSALHDFHLSGPGVDEATSIAGTGSTTWTVALTGGSYHFQCDAHPTIMTGDFSVGSGGTTTTGATTTAPTTTPAPPAPKLAARIVRLRTSRRTVTVTLSATGAGRATVDVLSLGGHRLARAARSVGRRPSTLTLRPAHPLAAGRYRVRARVVAAGRAAVASRVFRIR